MLPVCSRDAGTSLWTSARAPVGGGAETLEAATEGAALLSPRYDSEPARIGLDAAESFVPPGVGVGNPEMRTLITYPEEGSGSAAEAAA